MDYTVDRGERGTQKTDTHTGDRPMQTTLSPAEAVIMEMLEREPKGALTSIGAVKGRVKMAAGTVNLCLYALACKGLVNLHRHDYPSSMNTREKTRALIVGDAHYVGVALRA
jgi:predicted transcriptional regulator